MNWVPPTHRVTRIMSEYAQMETMAQRKVWTIHTSIMNQPSLRVINVPQTKVVKEALSAVMPHGFSTNYVKFTARHGADMVDTRMIPPLVLNSSGSNPTLKEKQGKDGIRMKASEMTKQRCRVGLADRKAVRMLPKIDEIPNFNGDPLLPSSSSYFALVPREALLAGPLSHELGHHHDDNENGIWMKSARMPTVPMMVRPATDDTAE